MEQGVRFLLELSQLVFYMRFEERKERRTRRSKEKYSYLVGNEEGE